MRYQPQFRRNGRNWCQVCLRSNSKFSTDFTNFLFACFAFSLFKGLSFVIWGAHFHNSCHNSCLCACFVIRENMTGLLLPGVIKNGFARERTCHILKRNKFPVRTQEAERNIITMKFQEIGDKSINPSF